MKAIIMAGGEGRRLKSVSGDKPKPMVLLAGKPVLEHILSLLKRNGIEDVCLSLHYRPEAIRDYFGNGERCGMRIRYHVEAEPMGTAGGVKACQWFYGRRDFLVISGDCACDFDLKQLIEAHRRHRPALTMALYAHPIPLPYGCVLTDQWGRVVSFTEKPAWEQVVTDMVNTGIYVISPAAMDLVPEGTMFDFSKDLFPRLMAQGQEIRGLPLDGYWCDIGSPAAYHRCNLDALEGKLKLEGMHDTDTPAALSFHVPEPPGMRRELLCRDRARVMRLLSLSLMEAGADFSDGLTLNTREGRVRITPSGEYESIIIRAQGKTPDAAAALAGKMEHFVKKSLEKA